jgi:transcriptional regulator with XRE-family HTH domain
MSKGLVNAGTKLKLIRQRNGFTQKAIASFLGVDKKLLSAFEAGKNTLSVGEIEKLATLYGLDVFTAQGGVDKIKIITLPFKTKEISKEDLESIYVINKIALNSDFMTKLMKINWI